MAYRSSDNAGNQIRVLIIDDLIETAQTVGKWLTTVPDLRVVDIATSAREGIEKAHRHHPHIILMDIFMPDMDGLEAAKIIIDQMPAQVILMSVEDGKDLMQQAFKVGARDFLVKPLRADEVLRAIHRVVQTPDRIDGPPNPRGTSGQHMVAICGAKGGVGRSLIATNLAVALTELSEKVLLIDGNLQSGDDHILLNLDHVTNSLDMMREPEDLDLESLQQIAVQHESGLRFIRAPEDVDAAREFRRETMNAILVEVREHFDITVVDADIAFSDPNEAILEQADKILVVTTPEITAINRTKMLMETFRRKGIALENCWLVGNRIDGGYQITPKRIEQSLGWRFAAQLPDDVHTIISAINHGVPFVTHHRRTPIAHVVNDLAKRLYQDLITMTKPRP
jgi:pilus assembly protein CpaE